MLIQAGGENEVGTHTCQNQGRERNKTSYKHALFTAMWSPVRGGNMDNVWENCRSIIIALINSLDIS